MENTSGPSCLIDNEMTLYKTRGLTLRDHRIRQLVDLPVVGHPTRLRIRVPRFTCANTACTVKIFQQQLICAKPKAKLTARCTRSRLGSN